MEANAPVEERTQLLTCRICSTAGPHRRFEVREMMFGMPESFLYFECAGCGCVQIKDIPADLAPYYKQYYSHEKLSRLRIFLKRQWITQPLRGTVLLKRLLCFLPGYNPLPEWIARHPVPKNSAILDVGCGVGQHLLELRSVGYRNLLGLDPFLNADIDYDNGVRVKKAGIDQAEGLFDLISLHHSLEHMPDQRAVLSKVGRLLAPNGLVVLRLPVAGSYAARRYGVNWVGLDAPRHLYLHTPKSVDVLAAACGLEVFDSYCDVNELSLLWSEQYERGITLFSPESVTVRKDGGIFSKRQLREFRKLAADLNKKGEGDQMAFYLRKASLGRGPAV